MSELPQITLNMRASDHTGLKSARAPRSVDHLHRSYAGSATAASYAERFHYITKTVNYEEMNDQAVWREYEKLRDCLKVLNEQILSEMEKKALVMRKAQPPQTKSQQDALRQLEEQFKVKENLVRGKKQQLTSTENRMKFLTKQGIREELQIECEQVAEQIAKLRTENKDYRRKSKLLARDLVTAPQLLLQQLLNLEQEIVMADRKVYKQKKRTTESDKLVEESIERFNELTNAIQSRQDQYRAVSRYVEQEINVQLHDELKEKRDALKKYESPLKRNYLLKLKDLDALIQNVTHHDKVINQTQQSIVAIRTQVDSIGAILNAKRATVTQQKNYAKPLRYKQTDNSASRRHASMMEIREDDDKNDERTTNPTPPPVK